MALIARIAIVAIVVLMARIAIVAIIARTPCSDAMLGLHARTPAS